MAKSTSLPDLIATVWGVGDRLTWTDTAFTVNLDGLQDDAEMLGAAQYALQVWTEVTGFTFTNDATAEIVFDNEGAGANATNYFYNDGNGGRFFYHSDINVAKDFQDGFPVGQQWGVGDYGVQVFIHEIGHAFGLRHPGDYNAGGNEAFTYENNATYAMDTYQYSVMSYFNQSNYSDASNLYVATPMLVDLAAIEELYGPLNANLDNTTYGESGVYDFSIDAAFTIADNGGIDVIDLSAQTLGARIDLNAGAFSDVNGHIKNVTIALGTTIENAIGGSAADQIIGNEFANHLRGLGGNDTLFGGGGNDQLDGGTGADTMDGGAGNDTYFVDNAGDILIDSAGTDRLFTTIDYTLANGAGIERMYAVGADGLTLTGNRTANLIVGANGDDTLIGGSGNDSLSGGAGNDILVGGVGLDVLTGGTGEDIFLFDQRVIAGNIDSITDFSVADDTIHLDNAIFTKLGADGALNARMFAIGTAQDANDRLLYDSATGALSYDADGSGAKAALQFAHLDAGLALTAQDFLIV